MLSATVKRRNVICASGLEDGITVKDVYKKFAKFGPVDKIQIFREEERNGAFITFRDEEDARALLKEAPDDPTVSRYNLNNDFFNYDGREHAEGIYLSDKEKTENRDDAKAENFDELLNGFDEFLAAAKQFSKIDKLT